MSTVLTNIASLKAIRQLDLASKAFSSSAEKLSTGLRINRASDDAAALQVSESLNVNSRIRGQAVRNINDGLSLVQIASGALSQLSAITLRLQELAQQGANGVLGDSQREAIGEEADALVDEFNRIATSTQFNNMNLFGDGVRDIYIEVGHGTAGGINFELASGLSRAIGTGEFTSSTTLPNFTETRGMWAGDINGDGKDDIVCGNYGTVSVALGNGDGTFLSSRNYGGSGNWQNLQTVDLNEDGHLDVFAVDMYAATAYIVTGNGDGSFNLATSLAMPYIGQAEFADLDEDGVEDLLYRSQSTNDVLVSYGNGNGTFRQVISFTTAWQPVNPAAADVNGDGRTDILVLSRDGVQVALQTASGGYSLQPVATMYTETSVVDDFNGDGHVDIVSKGSSNQFMYALGNGDGTFKAQVTFVTGPAGATGWLRSTDVNGDGINDIQTTGGAGSNFILTIFANGDGTFKAPVSLSSGETSVFAHTADFNGDGVQEMVLIGAGGTNQIKYQGITKTVSVNHLDLETQAGAKRALTTLTAQEQRIATETALLGSAESRLLVSLSLVERERDLFAEAASRITDVDVAEEVAKLSRASLLQKSAQAILAQANLQPELILNLLKED